MAEQHKRTIWELRPEGLRQRVHVRENRFPTARSRHSQRVSALGIRAMASMVVHRHYISGIDQHLGNTPIPRRVPSCPVCDLYNTTIGACAGEQPGEDFPAVIGPNTELCFVHRTRLPMGSHDIGVRRNRPHETDMVCAQRGLLIEGIVRGGCPP